MQAGVLEIALQANMARLVRDMDTAKRTVTGAMGNIEKAVGSAKSALNALGLGIGVAGLMQFARAAATAAAQSEQASARINATLKATGFAAGVTKKQLDDLADAMAKSTQFDDESIRNASAQFLKFGNIQDGVFQRGIKLAADLAALMGTEVPDAAQALGKALSSPAEGVGTLERQIGKLTAAQKDSIEQFIKVGDLAGAQSAILDILQSKIGGTAEAMNTGITKSTRDLAKAWDEFLEAVGKTSFPNTMISGFSTLLTDLTEQINGTSNAFRQALADWALDIAKHMPSINAFLFAMAMDPGDQIPGKREASGVIGGGPLDPKVMAAAAAERIREELRAADAERQRKAAEDKAEAARKALEDKKKADAKYWADFDKQTAADKYEEMIGNADLRNKHLADEAKKQEEADKANAERIKELSDLQRRLDDEREREQEQAARDQLRRQEELAKDINRSLTDALLRGFESGKDFAKNFRDTLVNMFKTLVLQPVINFILSPITGGIAAALSSGSAAAGQAGGIGGGFDGMISAVKGGWDIFKNGLDATNIAFEQSIQTLGTKIVDMGFDKLGGMISRYSGQIATALPYAASVFKLMQGDVKGAAFTAAGTAIGTYFGGPIGGAIGSFIGSAVGGLFGGDTKNPRAAVRLMLDPEGARRETKTYSKDGGSASTARAMASQFVDSFEATLDLLGVKLAREIGLSAAYNSEKGINFTYRTGVNGDDLAVKSAVVGKKNAGNAAAYVQLAALLGEGLLPDWLEKLALSLDRVTKKGEENLAFVIQLKQMHDALGNLPPEFRKVQAAMEAMVTKENAANFAALTQGVTTFYELFYSEQEKFDFAQTQLQKSFAELNLSLPTTRDAFRALVESVDVSTKSGLDLYSQLIVMAPAMDGYLKALEAQRQELVALTVTADTFRNKVDFTRALRYQENGIPQSLLPSFDVGSNYIPSDMTANVHQGERIIPAADNRELMARLRDPQANSAALVNEIQQLRAENKAQAVALVSATQKMAKILDKFDNQGIVLSETDNSGTRIVMDTRTVA